MIRTSRIWYDLVGTTTYQYKTIPSDVSPKQGQEENGANSRLAAPIESHVGRKKHSLLPGAEIHSACHYS